MASTEKDMENGLEQAKAQYSGIVSLIERLRHISECTDPDCELPDEEILSGLNMPYSGQTASEDDREKYHDDDEAREAITENALEVSVRSSWHSAGSEEGGKPDEYLILLCWGGPAVRITGELGIHGEPETAVLEWQDWFTPWVRYREADQDILVEFASQFWFGE
jgi:hypothetical protein